MYKRDLEALVAKLNTENARLEDSLAEANAAHTAWFNIAEDLERERNAEQAAHKQTRADLLQAMRVVLGAMDGN